MQHAIRLKIGLSGDANLPSDRTITLTGNGLMKKGIGTDEFASGAEDVEMSIAFAIASAKLIAIVPKTVPVTVKSNDDAEPDDTFQVTPDNPYYWWAGSGNIMKFTEDVTKLFFSNDSESELNLSGEVDVIVLHDATP